MRKKEWVALGVVVAVVVVGVGFHFAKQAFEQHELDQIATASNQMVEMGESMLLDADADRNDTVGNLDYVAGLPWNGTLEVSVISATLYDSPEDAGLSSEAAGFASPFDSLDGTAFLLCEVSITNIDATPDHLASGGESWFSISFFESSDWPYLDYFDGAPEGAAERDLWYFDLPQGESKTFHIGYVCPNDEFSVLRMEESLRDGLLYLSAGVAGDSVRDEKYRFHLDVTDKRGTSQVDKQSASQTDAEGASQDDSALAADTNAINTEASTGGGSR